MSPVCQKIDMRRYRYGSKHWSSVSLLLLIYATISAVPLFAQSIDRRALVERHKLHFDRYLPRSPASLGNGEFAFSLDITGLQTLGGEEPGSVPLGTMAQWAWHSFPESKQYRYEDTLRQFNVHGRQISYATDMRSETAQAIRRNPHRFSLARIALCMNRQDGSAVSIDDLHQPHQTVSLWSGEAVSRFKVEKQSVEVHTVVHPSLDAVACRVESPLVADGRLTVEVSFAYPSGEWGPIIDDWNRPERHQTTISGEQGVVQLQRVLDETKYEVNIRTNGVVLQQEKPHSVVLSGGGSEVLDATFHFVREQASPTPVTSFSHTRQSAAEHWAHFWSTGGAIDLSASSDPRWRELERRIVLSQFLTAIHCSGSMPPQETGLVCNSWFGKSHLEMHWWHAAHFAMWGRSSLLERSLAWYEQIVPAARAIAKRQGYAGVRWPKMTGPTGVSSPSEVGELLIWQQPHPIYFAELIYRANPDRAVLQRYSPIVFETAEFMADYAHYNDETEQYDLGPVLIPAQECYDGRSSPGVLNPTFELAYWRWGLQTANRWRERLGYSANPKWAKVAQQMARPRVRNGTYPAIQNPPHLRRRDHPSMLAALGVVPDVAMVDRHIMRQTLQDVLGDWNWKETWGWDYPMMALTAARLGDQKLAIEALLLETPKNMYLPNGHCWQEERLPVYLPANGGLLMAAAMMAAGWDGVEPRESAPGFPHDGSWVVRHEGLQRMP